MGDFPSDVKAQNGHNPTMSNLWKTRVRSIIQARGLSMKEVSLRSGHAATFVRDILERGRSPSVDNFLEIAAALGVSAGELLGIETQSIPLLGWVSAGDLATADITETLTLIEIAGLGEGDWIALRVTGDSMDRISPPDSVIAVNRRDKRLVPNACYVIADADGDATYKRFRPEPMRFEPVSTNPAHEPLFPDQEPLVVGRVKRSFIDM